MDLNMKNFTEQFKNIWSEISFSHKFIMISITLAFLAGIIGVTQWARKPDFGLLYGDLSPKASSEIINQLKEENISYKISGNGSMILVPRDKIYELRLRFAGEGLPHEETGYELLDKVSFGTSDFIQKINYRRALQGELAKTIRHLDYIDWAQVHLAVPEESLFVEDETPPTASVVLKLRTGGRLSEERVSSIVHLVSSSVEGLKPQDVTVTDTRGNLLSEEASPSSIAGTSNDQLEIKKRLEDYYVAKAQDILERIVGLGKSVVRVSADLDFKQLDEKHIEFDPERRVPKVQTITTRISGGAPYSGGGVPGMQANLNVSQSGIMQSARTSEEEETARTQYELSKIERVISDHGASLNRLSVAVLVDGKYKETETEDGEKKKVYVPRSKDELNRIASLVKQALGVDDSRYRKDSFEIQNVQFHEPDYDETEATIKEEQQKEFILKLAKNGSLGITVLAFLLFVMRSMKKLKKQKGAPVIQKKQTGAIPPEDSQTASAAKNVSVEDEIEKMLAEEADDDPASLIESAKKAKKREQVINNIKKEPNVAASSLKRWIADDLITTAKKK